MKTLMTNLFIVICLSFMNPCYAIDVEINFDQPLQVWDGFGVNYVETAQTHDYYEWPQEYGGFSLMGEDSRQKVLNMIFSEDGLKPAIIKMFLDPFHEGLTEEGNDNDNPYVLNQDGFDHKTTTRWLRYFAREGLKITRNRGDDLKIITTLYGPPPWMTEQRIMRGRDLDDGMKYELAEYMIAWAKFLIEQENLPVKYISLHNEGESEYRWLDDGTTEEGSGHDYNMWWPPDTVVDFLRFMPPMMVEHSLKDVGLTPGETTQWHRFLHQRYAQAILEDPIALQNLGLITSHGFSWGGPERALQHITPQGIDILKDARPELHVWTTSMSWFKEGPEFIQAIADQIYITKVNAIIPWAIIKTNTWRGGDPNPAGGFFVNGAGRLRILAGYYTYKQVSRAGQPGMHVAATKSSDNDISAIAFAKNNTNNPNAFAITNDSEQSKEMTININGIESQNLTVFRTIVDNSERIKQVPEKYKSLPDVEIDGNTFTYTAPAYSITTFYAK